MVDTLKGFSQEPTFQPQKRYKIDTHGQPEDQSNDDDFKTCFSNSEFDGATVEDVESFANIVLEEFSPTSKIQQDMTGIEVVGNGEEINDFSQMTTHEDPNYKFGGGKSRKSKGSRKSKRSKKSNKTKKSKKSIKSKKIRKSNKPKRSRKTKMYEK